MIQDWVAKAGGRSLGRIRFAAKGASITPMDRPIASRRNISHPGDGMAPLARGRSTLGRGGVRFIRWTKRHHCVVAAR